MSNSAQNGKDVHAVVQQAVSRHGATPDGLIPVLSEVNQALGYLPPEALDEIGRQVRVPNSRVFSVASFYRMLSTKPRGRHVVQFCENAPCHVVGGRAVWRALREQLGLASGETSADGRWTLLTTSCLGICAVGPVVVIDGDIYGNVNAAQLPDILARYA
jgi:NADH:ubiquinone oxidoreductase subunit E